MKIMILEIYNNNTILLEILFVHLEKIEIKQKVGFRRKKKIESKNLY